MKKKRIGKRAIIALISLLVLGAISYPLFNYFIEKEGIFLYRQVSDLPLDKLETETQSLLAKATLLATEGKMIDALDNCLIGLKIAQSLNSKPDLKAQLVRLNIDNLVLKNLQFILKMKGQKSPLLKNLTLRKYRLLIQEIEKEKRAHPVSLGIKGEKELIEKSVSSRKFFSGVNEKEKKELVKFYLQRGGGISLKKFVNRQELFYLKSLERMIFLTKRHYWDGRKRIEALNKEVRGTSRGKALLTQMKLPGLLKAYTQEARTDALLGGAEIALALKIYQSNYKKVPSSLEKIIPEILPSLPLDPFTGKAYIYKKRGKGFILYGDQGKRIIWEK